MSQQTSKVAVEHLIVSRRDAGRLGTIDFDASYHATLSTEGSGADVDALKKAWEEISSKAKLSWVTAVEEERDGKKVTAIRGVEFGPGEGNYFYAVLDTLSRKYGFSVDIAK